MSRQPILFLFLDSLKIRNPTKNKPEKLFAAPSTVESHLVFCRHVFSLNSANAIKFKNIHKGHVVYMSREIAKRHQSLQTDITNVNL